MLITGNCRQIWHLNQPMNLIVSSIVGGVNEQNSIVNLKMIRQPKCRQLLVMCRQKNDNLMDMKKVIQYSSIGLQQNRNNETELIDTILDGYNVQARPIRNLSQPINVAIGFHLSKVLDLVSIH